MMVCRMTAGQSSKPCSALAKPTYANRMATAALKAKRPTTTLRRDPASLEGKHARPSATRAIPAKRPSGMPMASGLAPNRSRHRTSGTVRKRAPTTISSHAAAPTTNLCCILSPSLGMYASGSVFNVRQRIYEFLLTTVPMFFLLFFESAVVEIEKVPGDELVRVRSGKFPLLVVFSQPGLSNKNGSILTFDRHLYVVDLDLRESQF